MKPKLLDLFCGAGGCAMGYHRAGFDVIGVDLTRQPRYPFPFVRADALRPPFDLRMFDAIHASPPCQSYSVTSHLATKEYPRLIEPVRRMLIASRRPYVIENVPGSPLVSPIVLCAATFGLKMYRHRLFETNFLAFAPPHQKHVVPCSKAGHWREGTFISVCGNSAPIKMAREEMGIDWMNRDELAESIPPVYTEHIGKILISLLAESHGSRPLSA